jgi:hypothetical protein
MKGMLRSSWRVLLDTYHGAPVILRKVFDNLDSNMIFKNAVFRDMTTPCSSCKNRRFGGIYRLLLVERFRVPLVLSEERASYNGISIVVSVTVEI